MTLVYKESLVISMIARVPLNYSDEVLQLLYQFLLSGDFHFPNEISELAIKDAA